MNVAIIANPVAGRRGAVAGAHVAAALLEARGVSVVLHETSAPGHACELWMLPTWPAPRLRLRGDFGEREGPYLLAAAGNTSRYGGGVMMTPGASPYDGVLDCCLVRDLPRLKALALLPRTYSGTHGRHAEVEMVRTRTLEIEADGPVFMTADGELMGESRATIGVAQGALLLAGRDG